MIFAKAPYHIDQRPGIDTGMLDIKIPTERAISELVLECFATNGSSGNATNPLSTCITQIEVLHPFSRALYDISADMLQLVAHIDDKRVPYSSEADTANLVQRIELPLRFGRYPGDPLYFMPGALENETVLRVHYDLTTVRACGDTGFVSGSFGLRTHLLWGLDATRGAVHGTRALLQGRDQATVITTGAREDIIPQRPPFGVYVWAYKSGTAEGDLVDEVTISAEDGIKELAKYPWQVTQRDQIDNDGSVVGYMVYCPTADQGTPTTPAKPYSDKIIEIAANQLVAAGAMRFINSVEIPAVRMR